jgi:hypothetical protein
MAGDDFLRRWSRLKRQSASDVKKPAEKPDKAPELPAIDSLTFESDFKAFLHEKVEESVKRAALKKLFADPRFNVMDGLDTYIDDYTKEDPISEEMLATLEHARQTLFGPKEEPEEARKDEPQVAAAPAEPPEQKPNGNPGQDA